MDLCIIVDSSGSIRDNNLSDNSYDNWALVLQFVSRVDFLSLYFWKHYLKFQLNRDCPDYVNVLIALLSISCSWLKHSPLMVQ